LSDRSRVDLCRAFLLLVDTAPLYEEDDDASMVRASELAEVARLVADERNASGVTIAPPSHEDTFVHVESALSFEAASSFGPAAEQPTTRGMPTRASEQRRREEVFMLGAMSTSRATTRTLS
jgi:hypothetical protein